MTHIFLRASKLEKSEEFDSYHSTIQSWKKNRGKKSVHFMTHLLYGILYKEEEFKEEN